MLARMQRLQAQGKTDHPASIETAFGSLAAFAEDVNAKIAAGRLDFKRGDSATVRMDGKNSL